MPLGSDESSLGEYLERATGRTIALTITDNTTSMLSLRREKNRIVVRLHRIFLGASTDVLDEIARFIRDGRGKTPLFMKFVKQNSSGIRQRPARSAVLRTVGKYHDLRDMFVALNSEYFGNRLSCPVTWGARTSRYAARKRTLGSYNRTTDTIRINPLLDRRTTPAYFVQFVLYHEMLHADIETAMRNGRRLVHSREFRQRERLFRHYKKAAEWEKKGL